MSRNRIYAFLVAAVAAIIFFASTASCFYPGESASLVAAWKGLSACPSSRYPVMAVVARMLGGGNLLAPISATIAVFLLFNLVSTFLASAFRDDYNLREAEHYAHIGATAAVAVFALIPAVRSAATHLEPRMFHFAWATAVIALAIPLCGVSRKIAWAHPLLTGALVGIGIVDSPLFFAFLVFYLPLVVFVARRNGLGVFSSLAVFFFSFAALYGVTLLAFGLPLAGNLSAGIRGLRLYVRPQGWLYVLLFSTLPFVAALFAARRAFAERPRLVHWTFHIAISFASVLALATPLAAGKILARYGILPVASSAFAAVLSGYLIVFWWYYRRQVVSVVAGSAYAFVVLVVVCWNLFDFNSDDGDFADRVARAIIGDLGERRLVVTDGSLDDHLMLAAADSGRRVIVVSLQRDTDERYLKSLAEVVRKERIGGDKSEQLSLSLTLGVLPFVKEYLKTDPAASRNMVIMGAPDLWLSAGIEPVPEFFFFGGDPYAKPDWTRWKEFDGVLFAQRGWGSYHEREVVDPVTSLRLNLRRHLGLMANDRGVYLQDHGRDDEAWKMYELVLNEIDRDNISAIFNEVAMLSSKHEAAVAKKRELDRLVRTAVDDKRRRYLLWQLGTYYGYIRNPEVFVRLGHIWARSGRPGEALAQLNRAIDFVADDKRNTLINMIASLYAGKLDRVKSRELYESVIAKNSRDHDALVGMMRLELAAGNDRKAIEYLERAAASATDKRRIETERAMISLMKHDLSDAKARFRRLVQDDLKDMQSWSLLSATLIQMIDDEKDGTQRAKLERELETVVTEMGRQSRDASDYYLQSARGFLLLRKGEKERRAAREAFAAAAAARPDALSAQDMVLGLDISLNDRAAAENHARAVLRRNADAPFANFVMGSISIGKGELAAAEMFLRRSVAAENPPPAAYNDLAETLRRRGEHKEAEKFARKCVRIAPKLYIAWETLGTIIADSGGDISEAIAAVERACELSRGKDGRETDLRMLLSLARIQVRGERLPEAKKTLSRLASRVSKLDAASRKEYLELVNRVK